MNLNLSQACLHDTIDYSVDSFFLNQNAEQRHKRGYQVPQCQPLCCNCLWWASVIFLTFFLATISHTHRFIKVKGCSYCRTCFDKTSYNQSCHQSSSGVRLKCYYAFFLMCCGCDTSYIVWVHIQCQASIYIHFRCVAGIHGGCG